MHWVDRGPEPDDLVRIRSRYTPGWVDHYHEHSGPKPSDTRWREFIDVLADDFGYLCGYCEKSCRGEVDHFRPKSKFPGLVYEWSNWIFACHDCNHMKSDAWPGRGFVDPCAKSQSAQPEHYFTFDTVTAEVVPRQDLTPGRWRKAMNMIDALRLNEFHHLKNRLSWLEMVSTALSNDDEFESPLVNLFTNRNTQLSSITRVWLAEQAYLVEH